MPLLGCYAYYSSLFTNYWLYNSQEQGLYRDLKWGHPRVYRQFSWKPGLDRHETVAAKCNEPERAPCKMHGCGLGRTHPDAFVLTTLTACLLRVFCCAPGL